MPSAKSNDKYLASVAALVINIMPLFDLLLDVLFLGLDIYLDRM